MLTPFLHVVGVFPRPPRPGSHLVRSVTVSSLSIVACVFARSARLANSSSVRERARAQALIPLERSSHHGSARPNALNIRIAPRRFRLSPGFLCQTPGRQRQHGNDQPSSCTRHTVAPLVAGRNAGTKTTDPTALDAVIISPPCWDNYSALSLMCRRRRQRWIVFRARDGRKGRKSLGHHWSGCPIPPRIARNGSHGSLRLAAFMGEHDRQRKAGRHRDREKSKDHEAPLHSHPKPVLTIPASVHLCPHDGQNQAFHQFAAAPCDVVRVALRTLHRAWYPSVFGQGGFVRARLANPR